VTRLQYSDLLKKKYPPVIMDFKSFIVFTLGLSLRMFLLVLQTTDDDDGSGGDDEEETEENKVK